MKPLFKVKVVDIAEKAANGNLSKLGINPLNYLEEGAIYNVIQKGTYHYNVEVNGFSFWFDRGWFEIVPDNEEEEKIRYIDSEVI